MNELQAEVLSRVISIIFIAFGLYIFYKIVERKAQKRVLQAKEFYICPKCGSLNLSMLTRQTSISNNLAYRPSTTSNFECKECGYEGICPLIEKEYVERFKKEIEKRKNHNKN